MKKIILIAIISSLNLILLFGQSFPGDSPELLINKTVKPKASASLEQYNYANFYHKFDKVNKKYIGFNYDNTPFRTGGDYSTRTKYSELVGKEFNVVAIYEVTRDNSFLNKEYAIEIVNEDIGTIFYNYDPKYERDFELEVVGGLDLPVRDLCDDIEYQNDKFENIERFYAPIEKGITFMKTIKNGKSTIYMTVMVLGEDLNVNGKGAWILFDDGTKISRPNVDLKVDVNEWGYRYAAFIELTKDDIKLLTEKTMTDKRLVIYDDSIDIKTATILKEYLKCLVK